MSKFIRKHTTKLQQGAPEHKVIGRFVPGPVRPVRRTIRRVADIFIPLANPYQPIRKRIREHRLKKGR